jgi:hypothetical protein
MELAPDARFLTVDVWLDLSGIQLQCLRGVPFINWHAPWAFRNLQAFQSKQMSTHFLFPKVRKLKDWPWPWLGPWLWPVVFCVCLLVFNVIRDLGEFK